MFCFFLFALLFARGGMLLKTLKPEDRARDGLGLVLIDLFYLDVKQVV